MLHNVSVQIFLSSNTDWHCWGFWRVQWQFPLGQLPPWNSLHDNFPRISIPRQMPLNNSPLHNYHPDYCPPPPSNSPQDNYHLDFCPPGNCPWMIPPWTTSLRTITPGIWPSRQLPLNDCPWVTASWTITPMKFPCISTTETLMNK